MSDLREAIAQEVRVAYYRSLAAHELPCSDNQANVIGKIAADAVLDVVTAHMTVTDEDAIQLLRGYWRNVGASFGEMEIMHMVELLEAFVARKLKGAQT